MLGKLWLLYKTEKNMYTTIIILAYGLPVSLVIGFYFGFKIASQSNENNALKVPKIVYNTNIKEPETDEERRQRIYNENIENFGTAVPQQEV